MNKKKSAPILLPEPIEDNGGINPWIIIIIAIIASLVGYFIAIGSKPAFIDVTAYPHVVTGHWLSTEETTQALLDALTDRFNLFEQKTECEVKGGVYKEVLTPYACSGDLCSDYNPATQCTKNGIIYSWSNGWTNQTTKTL